MVNTSFHYPHDLFNLLVETIPLLNKSKKDVFTFFQGAGVDLRLMEEIKLKWKQSPDIVTKYEITRNVLTKLNVDTDQYLRERREILKRIIEFDSFSSCWPDDQLKAKGFVSEIKQITGLKDNLTKTIQIQEKDREEKRKATQKKAEEQAIKNNLFQLFNDSISPQKRGKTLEGVLNSLFKIYGISIREDFKLRGDNKEGIIEQIDGVI